MPHTSLTDLSPLLRRGTSNVCMNVSGTNSILFVLRCKRGTSNVCINVSGTNFILFVLKSFFLNKTSINEMNLIEVQMLKFFL